MKTNKANKVSEKQFKCVICNENSKGWGNNPAPVKESGRCCDKCNGKEVIPARLQNMFNR